MKKTIALIAAISTSFLASCAMDPSQKKEEAIAKSFTPQPGRANVYVYRPWTLTPWVMRTGGVCLNGKSVGPLPDCEKRFVMFDIPPGEYTISSKGGVAYRIGFSEHKFTARSGENVFYKIAPIFMVDVIVAYTPPISWTRVPEAEGRKEIMSSKLSAGIETVN